MNSLIKFKEFVNEINAQNGRLYKESVLEKYKDDEDVQDYLRYVFDPFIIFGVSDKKLNKNLKLSSYYDEKFTCVKDVFEYLKDHNTGKDYDIQQVQAYKALELPVELWDIYESIITKNLQLGVDTKTINKIIPKLISEFNVMLANKYFDKPEIVEGKEFALTTKIDGCRIIAIKENGEVSFWTRQGQKYEGLVDLEAELLNNFPDNICLDGELTLLDKGNLDSGEQYKATTKLCRKDGEKHGLKMLVFDSMSSEDFKNQSNNTPYSLRRQILDDIFNSNWAIQKIDFQTGEEKISEKPKEFKFFELLPILYQGNDTSKIIEWLNYNISKGEEGVMINIYNAPYQFKRTNSLLKVKKFLDIDLQVIGYQEGSNSNEGKLGALLCSYKGNVVKVGSGFTNSEVFDENGNLIQPDERKEIWNHKDEWINKIITVGYFEETHNANGEYSLRFPTYRGERVDKGADL